MTSRLDKPRTQTPCMPPVPRERYDELDRAIVKHLQESLQHPIYASTLLHLASELLALPPEHIEDYAWRLIDRRLQALRRLGSVSYSRQAGSGHGWIVTAKALPQLDAVTAERKETR